MNYLIIAASLTLALGMLITVLRTRREARNMLGAKIVTRDGISTTISLSYEDYCKTLHGKAQTPNLLKTSYNFEEER